MTSRNEPNHPIVAQHAAGGGSAVPLGHALYPIDPGQRRWRWTLLCAALVFGALIAAGTLDSRRSIVDLLLQGAVTPVASPPQEEAASPPIEVEFTPPPPPEPNPEFVQPKPQPPPQPPPPLTKKPETKPEAPRPIPARTVKTAAVPAPQRPAMRYASAAPRVGDANTPKPPYPYEAAMRRYQGTVQLSLTVAQGKLLAVDVVQSSGFGILDSTARQWIRQRWRLPASLSGSYTIPIVYRLE